MDKKIWTRSSMSFKHMSFWGPFLDSHLTTHHSNAGVGFKMSNQMNPS